MFRLILTCTIYIASGQIKMYHEDPCPGADVETLVVDVTATESYYDSNGDLVNVVPHALLARQTLEAINPRLQQAYANNEYGIISELENVKREMEKLLESYGTVIQTRPKGSKKTKTKSLKSSKSSKGQAPLEANANSPVLSPAVNLFAFIMMMTVFSIFAIICCIICFYSDKANTTRVGRVRVRKN